MPKKKSSKNSDQPELPLDSPSASEPKADVKPPKAAAKNDEPTVVAPPPPKRKKGEKVQDDQAPLAKSYRNWFLDYASYVILDRAVPHLDDGLKPRSEERRVGKECRSRWSP